MLLASGKNQFPLDESAIYLDHGAFGVTPCEVIDEREKIARELEKAPTPFFVFRYRPAWRKIAARVAERFRVEPDELALIDNVTDGINAILRSLVFQPGDEILVASSTYGAILNAATHIAERQGARVVQTTFQFPNPSSEQCVEAVRSAITPRTRLAILDHISSMTAVVMPIAQMTKVCHAKGVPVLVDGAHAPGNIVIDMRDIDPDWYVANLHKWYFVPRSCGFLWRSSRRPEAQVPTVLSWDINLSYPSSFEWTGTRDPSAWLSIPAAFAFMDRFGEANVREHNHALLQQGRALLADAWGIKTNIPDEMIGSMALAPLPDGMPFATTDEGAKKLQELLWERWNIVVSVPFVQQERIWLRISAQVYNRIEDYRSLAETVLAIRDGAAG